MGKTVVPEAVRVLENTGLEFDFQHGQPSQAFTRLTILLAAV